jgi:hypothetical protein
VEQISLIHEQKVFHDCTIYLTGNSYYDCKFYRCTFVVREGGIPALVGWHIECCVWHIDLMISDHRVWESFLRTMGPLVQQSLPKAFGAEVDAVDTPPGSPPRP